MQNNLGGKKLLMKFSCHSRQILIATVLIDCYPPEQYSTCAVALEAVQPHGQGLRRSMLYYQLGLLGDLRRVTSPLRASVSCLQNGGSDTDCLQRALR